jgi:hypothetical protein
MNITANETLMDRSTTREVWHAERRNRFIVRKREAECAKRAYYMAMRHDGIFVPNMPCPTDNGWLKVLRKQQEVAGKLFNHCRELRLNRRLNRLVGILSGRYMISHKADLYSARVFFQWVKDGETEEELIAHVAKTMNLTPR